MKNLVLAAIFLAFMRPGGGQAAELTLLCAGALASSIKTLAPEFEKASGNSVKPVFMAIGAIAERIREGESADLIVVSPPQWEGLAKDGKIDRSVRVVLASARLGLFVKNGAPKLDTASLEAFKRALLDAKSIALGDPANGSPVGIYAVALFDRLGIAAELKPKLKLIRGLPIGAVANGEAEIGMAQLSEISGSVGVELAGVLPPAIQNVTTYTAAVPSNAREGAAAKALVEFLQSASAAAVFKSNGLDVP